MSRLAKTFSALKRDGAGALVTYVTVGDPDLTTSLAVVEALCRGGADILELGVPFSDPTADGPMIQRSSARALEAGTTVSGVLALVRQLRRRYDQPVILFGYYNPFLQYGLERLAHDAREAGVDGFLVVDLPVEEGAAFRAAAAAEELAVISLLTPTSTPARLARVAEVASGFVYYVSRTGVTGARVEDLAAVNAQVAGIQSAIALPVCVGFGVAEPSQVAALGRQADGVVVGSALVAQVEKLGRGEIGLEAIEAAVRALKAPLSPVRC